MQKADLLKRLAELESINDQLQTELRSLDRMMKDVGFQDGLQTLKVAAKEIIEEEGEI